MALLINYESNGAFDNPIGDLGADEYQEAQSITPGSTITVDYIDLYIRKVNSISAALTLRVETNSAGPIPSGTLVSANATTTNTPSNTSYAWVRFTFPASFQLTGSTKYWLVCSVPGGQATNDHYDWFFAGSGAGTYAGGGDSTKVTTGTNVWNNEVATSDFYFRVYGSDSTGMINFFLN